MSITPGLMRDIAESIELVRLPSSQVSMILYGYLDTLPDTHADTFRARLAENRSFAILAHRCAKEAIILSTLREMFQRPEEVDEYLAVISAGTDDDDLRVLRSGVIGMVLH